MANSARSAHERILSRLRADRSPFSTLGARLRKRTSARLANLRRQGRSSHFEEWCVEDTAVSPRCLTRGSISRPGPPPSLPCDRASRGCAARLPHAKLNIFHPCGPHRGNLPRLRNRRMSALESGLAAARDQFPTAGPDVAKGEPAEIILRKGRNDVR